MLNINNQRNINQNCNETLFHTSIKTITVGEIQKVERGGEGGRKKGKKTSINEDMENSEVSALLGELQPSELTAGTLWSFLRVDITIISCRNTTWKHIPKTVKSKVSKRYMAKG